jgi:hypothetical protein
VLKIRRDEGVADCPDPFDKFPLALHHLPAEESPFLRPGGFVYAVRLET